MTATPVLAPVPFADLGRQHAPLADALRQAFERTMTTGAFVLGAEVEAFEAEFAEYCGADHCVGVSSGTAALAIALRAAGIGPGDEVIVPAHTFIASALGVLHAGATPVFCDVDARTALIDPASAASAVSARTAAIVAVHLYGQPADMDALSALARLHGLLLLEDAAQAHGARLNGKRAGSLGDVAGFSFYPSKNLGALGDGGAVVTSDPQIAARARRLRNLGQERKGEHVELGTNDRLHGLQAALLRVKLPHLDAWNASRRRLAGRYDALLPPTVKPVAQRPDAESVHHLYAVRVAERDAVLARLADDGVSAGVHYAPAVHEQPPLAAAVSDRVPLHRSEAWAREELSLPMFAEMGDHEVVQVAAAIARATGGTAG